MTTEDDQKLCEAVGKLSVLNDKQDKYFKDRNKKKLAWEYVAKEVDLVNGK